MVLASKFDMMTRLPFFDVPVLLPLASMRWMTSLGISFPPSVLKLRSNASQSCPDFCVCSLVMSKLGVIRTMLFLRLLSLLLVLMVQFCCLSRFGRVAVRNSMMVSSLFICHVPFGSVMLKPACIRDAAACSSAFLFLVRKWSSLFGFGMGNLILQLSWMPMVCGGSEGYRAWT